MASPPFSLTTASPGDTDTVSQFPALDRSDKDVVQSWINTDHNVDGTHTKTTLVQVGTLLSDGVTTTAAPTPTGNRSATYRDTDGALKFKRGEDSTVEYVGIPPGYISWDAGSTLVAGWIDAKGQAISRTTFARLFTRYGTTYGAGDGSTTFNVPDIQNRTIIGQDLTGVARVTVAGGNFDGTVLGQTGGAQNHTLTTSEMPAHSHANSLFDPGHTHGLTIGTTAGFSNPTVVEANGSTGNGTAVQLNTTGIVLTNASAGSGNAHTVLQPTIVLRAVIKT